MCISYHECRKQENDSHEIGKIKYVTERRKEFVTRSVFSSVKRPNVAVLR